MIRIRINVKDRIRIRICIKVTSRIRLRIRIKVMQIHSTVKKSEHLDAVPEEVCHGPGGLLAQLLVPQLA